MGYHTTDPAAEERRALLRICTIIGLAMLIYLLIENLSIYVLITVIQVFGVDVGYSYSDNAVYGPELAVLAILMVQTLIKYLVPMLIFRKTFRMPRQAAYQLRPYVPLELPVSVCVTLIVFAAVNLWVLFSPVNLMGSSTLGTAYYAVSYMHPRYQLIYLIFEAVAVSILSEMLIHGEMLHVLRQFGDWFAILMTAVIGVCMSHSLITALMDLTLSLVIGISVLRSGSLLPAFLNRLLYHVLLFALFWMKMVPGKDMETASLIFMGLLFLAGLTGCLLLIRPARRNPALLPRKRYLTGRQRMATIVHASPLLIIFFLCLILMLIEVFF